MKRLIVIVLGCLLLLAGCWSGSADIAADGVQLRVPSRYLWGTWPIQTDWVEGAAEG